MCDADALSKLLNSSGFAFQLAIEEIVRGKQGELDFEIVAREHPWEHSVSGRSGFIDLVIAKGSVRFVVECKRTSDASWLFLAPGGASSLAQSFRCYWTMALDGEHEVEAWSKVFMSPKSPICQFCCVRGGGENQTSMLDRIGAELIYSTEALATGERRLKGSSIPGSPTIYVPVVVTNADLYVANFRPADLDLESGRIDSASFASAKYVRYEKALDPRVCTSNAEARTVKEMNISSQRSLFIVKAAELIEFLQALNFERGDFHEYPWIVASNQFGRRNA